MQNSNALTIFENPAPRCPVVLLLDTSTSMHGSPIRELNAGVAQFFEEIFSDEVARFSVETSIISFGDRGVRKLLPFSSNIEMVRPPRLEAGGMTPMGQGLSLAIREIRERRAFYKRSGMSSYKPWLVLMSDGMPNDEWQRAAQEAQSLSDGNQLVYLGVGIGDDVDWELFREILPRNRPPKALSGLKFREFFLWLSDSLRSVSQSSPSQSVPLPATDGWEAI